MHTVITKLGHQMINSVRFSNNLKLLQQIFQWACLKAKCLRSKHDWSEVKRLSYHGCSCGLGRDGCLTGLLLTGFDFGLQVCRRVKILALLPGAAALDIVHANGDSVISGVNHGTVTGVSEAAVCLSPRTVSPLKFAANLWKSNYRDGWRNSALSVGANDLRLHKH